MAIIEVNGLNKKYGDKKVLNNVAFTIEEGELIAITGVSGSGKSTILNILGLLEEKDSGEVIIDGEKNVKVNSSKARKLLRDKIAYLFQNFALIDEESVTYNLELALKYVSKNKADKKLKIEESLDRVGLKGYEKRKVFELSGGEQQRVALARIMLKPCKIILADEPTGSLDEKNREGVFNIIKELKKDGKTIVIVTHDNEIANRCDRVIGF